MTEQQPSAEDQASPTPNCPKCQGDMWDNRIGKRNPKAPDFKCKDKGCDGVVWPSREAVAAALAASPPVERPPVQAGAMVDGMPACPLCGGPMWDDRTSKRNPRAPDFKCRNKPKERGGPGCEGVTWPARDGSPSPYPQGGPRRPAGNPGMSAPPFDDTPPPDEPSPFDEDDLPF